MDIKLKKVDDELVQKILSARGWGDDKAEQVRKMLRYNAWTIRQYSDLVGKNDSTISNKTRPKMTATGEWKTELDCIYPFPNISTPGPKFILRNEKSINFLLNGMD